MKKKIEYEVGSGNVFADIGRPGAGEHLIKAHLVFKIGRIMKERGLKQIEAAGLFGVKQPHVSNMLRGSSVSFRSSGSCASSVQVERRAIHGRCYYSHVRAGITERRGEGR